MNTTLLSLSTFLSLLLLLHLPISIANYNNNNNLIQQTCKITPYYNLCISTLKSNSQSSKADVAGLGLIIVKALKSKTIVAIDQINKYKGSNPGLRRALSDCSSKYNAILKGDIAEAEQALEFGDPKFAETGMNDAANEASRCEKAFSGMKSPLTELNKVVNHLSLVALAISRLLL